MPQEAIPRPAPYPSTPASGDWSASPTAPARLFAADCGTNDGPGPACLSFSATTRCYPCCRFTLLPIFPVAHAFDSRPHVRASPFGSWTQPNCATRPSIAGFWNCRHDGHDSFAGDNFSQMITAGGVCQQRRRSGGKGRTSPSPVVTCTKPETITAYCPRGVGCQTPSHPTGAVMTPTDSALDIAATPICRAGGPKSCSSNLAATSSKRDTPSSSE